MPACLSYAKNTPRKRLLAHIELGLKEEGTLSTDQHHKDSCEHLVTTSSTTEILANLCIINEPFHESLYC